MPKKLRHGFRKEAEDYAIEFRQELGLGPATPLTAFQLAEHLEIPVIGLSKVTSMPPEIVDYYRGPGNSEFSATSLCDGTYREVIHNDFHHPNRQNSSVMHELAHIILGHPPKPPLMEDSCRHFDPVAEYEANQLGFTLLVPKKAALVAYEQFPSRAAAAAAFGVSVQVMELRIRITDAAGWARNRARRA